MRKTLTVGVALVFLAFAACGDDSTGGDPNCTDNDGDGYGVGDDCAGADCDDTNAQCWVVGDACCDPVCTDLDGDGYGDGAGCLGADCDDNDNTCYEGACCNAVDCTDLDGDGYGTGADCLGTDCDDSNNQCWVGACCPTANCVDNDGDGYGSGTDCAGPDCNDADNTCHEGTCCPEPGNGYTGEACTAPTDCTNITNGTPECLTSIGGYINFPGGYCTGSTCTVGTACDTQGGMCVDLMGYAQYCLVACTDVNDCRASEGYDCTTLPMSSDTTTYCLPPTGI